VVRATNTGNQSHTITLVTEGSQHYSYAVSTIPTQQGLTCDTLSGCSIIQTIQTDISNKFDKSGGTVTGATSFTGGLTANTISATTYQNLPTYVSATTLSLANVLSVTTGGGNPTNTTINAVTGGTYSNGTITLSGTGSVNGTQISGLSTVTADTFTTGFTYSSNTFTIARNQGQSNLTATINIVTGLTVNGNLNVTGNTGVGTSPSSGVKIWGYSTAASTTGVQGNGTIGGVYGITSTAAGFGVRGDAVSSIGVYGISIGDTGTNIGVQGYSDIDSSGSPTNIGGKFTATNGGTNYSLQLSDGTESIGRYLKCITSDGKANWADVPSSSFTGGTVSGPTNFTNGLTASTISATTIYGDGSNLTGVATFQQVLRITSLGI